MPVWMGSEMSVSSGKTVGCSWEEFQEVCAGAPGDLQQLHKKLHTLSSEDAREFLQWQSWHKAPEIGGLPVPHLKMQSYISSLCKKMPIRTLAVTEYEDEANLFLICMQRTAERKFGDSTVFRDDLFLGESMCSEQEFGTKLASAFTHILFNAVLIESAKESGSVVVVQAPSDCCILSRIVLPSFVSLLLEHLPAGSEEDLLLIPFAKDKVYATLSSSAGCSELATIISDCEAPDSFVQLAYRIRSIDRTAPELELLAQGKVPVRWGVYDLDKLKRNSESLNDDNAAQT